MGAFSFGFTLCFLVHYFRFVIFCSRFLFVLFFSMHSSTNILRASFSFVDIQLFLVLFPLSSSDMYVFSCLHCYFIRSAGAHLHTRMDPILSQKLFIPFSYDNRVLLTALAMNNCYFSVYIENERKRVCVLYQQCGITYFINCFQVKRQGI